ncbi:hypothetical protein SLA2020_452100 [Shorea laevis]
MEWKRPTTGIGSDNNTVTDLSTQGALGVKLLKCPLKTGLGLGYSWNIVLILGVSTALYLGVAGEDVAHYMPFELYRTIDFEKRCRFACSHTFPWFAVLLH